MYVRLFVNRLGSLSVWRREPFTKRKHEQRQISFQIYPSHLKAVDTVCGFPAFDVIVQSYVYGKKNEESPVHGENRSPGASPDVLHCRHLENRNASRAMRRPHRHAVRVRARSRSVENVPQDVEVEIAELADVDLAIGMGVHRGKEGCPLEPWSTKLGLGVGVVHQVLL